MVVRKNFDNEMNQLKQLIADMTNLANTALSKSMQALIEQNDILARHVIKEDEIINKHENEIEDLVVKIIAAQQPVASDLRKVMAALKIVNSVERIGDFAVDIAKAVQRIGQEELIKPLKDIPIMGAVVQEMLQKAMTAFLNNDIHLAKELAAMDDQVDSMYSSILKELLQKMVHQPDKLEQVMQLAYIARFIERIADHVTNVAEAILYSVKGKRIDLNR